MVSNDRYITLQSCILTLWTAAVGALGTFSNALIFSLGLFDREESGALAFGLVFAFAALSGTLFGGTITDFTLDRLGADPSSNRIMVALLPRISVGVGISVCFYLSTYFATSSAITFLTCMFFGFFFFFAIQSPIMRCLLNSVEEDYRPNALGMNAVLKHLLGDIPGTIIFGLIKDSLTPACIIDQKGEFLRILVLV